MIYSFQGEPMKRKILALLLLLSIVSTSAFSAWYDGLKIDDITYDGIINAPVDSIKDILYQYKGDNYSDALLTELQKKLQDLGCFTYFYPEATKNPNDSMGMIIKFHFYEIPLLRDVVFEGNKKIKDSDLLDTSGLQVGTFYKGTEMSLAKKKLEDYYKSKGYINAKIESSLTSDDKTSTVSLKFTIDEGRQVVIGEIAFSGNEKIPSDVLSAKVSSKTRSFFNNGYYDPTTIARDVQTLMDYYQSRGYAFARVSTPELVDISKPDDTFERVKAVFPVEEGEVWKLGSITFAGNTVYPTETLRSKITMQKGDEMDFTKFNEQLQQIASLYYDNGYIYFNIIPERTKDEDNHVINFNLKITEGPQATIRKIILNGTGSTQKEVYRRELTIHEGDIFSRAALIKSMQNLQNTLLLSDLNYDIKNTEDMKQVDVIFNLTEGGQKNVQFGATFGGTVTEFPISGFLTWTDNNFSGTGNDLSLSLTLSPSTQKVVLGYTDEWFGDIPWSNGFTLTFRHADETDILQRGANSPYYRGHASAKAYPSGYSSYEAYVAAGKATPAADELMEYESWRVAVGYNTGYTWRYDAGSLKASTGLSIGVNRASYDEQYDPYNYLIKLYADQWQFSNLLSIGLSWDGRDLVQQTTKGYLLTQTITYAGGVLGGISNYIKSATSFSIFRQIGAMKINGKKQKTVASFASSISFMFPQYVLSDGSWEEDAQSGATSSEMLYIDGMTIALGHDVLTDQAFLFDNKLSVETTLVDKMVAWDTFVSATTVKEYLSEMTGDPSDYTWYLAAGTGVKVKIPSLPIGLYLVKDATWTASDGFSWDDGSLFDFGSGIFNGMKIVLSISTNLF